MIFHKITSFIGSGSERSSMSSMWSLASLTGRSSRTPHKKASLDKMDGLSGKRKGSGGVAMPPQGVRKFIAGIVSPSTKRKLKNSSSDFPSTESFEDFHSTDSEKVQKHTIIRMGAPISIQ